MSFFKNIKEFIHNVTTSDHYAQYESEDSAASPRRGNTPLIGRNSSQISLQHNTSSLSLGGGQSRPSSSMNNNGGSSTNLNAGGSNTAIPYRPGMRSQLHNDSQIELRNYENGQPIRDILEVWNKIDEWLENEFPELEDDMQGGATANDLNAFEADLGISLPSSFRDSYQIHDGQVSMGKTRGLIFSYSLMDLETIAAETNIWRRVYERLEKREAGTLPFGVQKSCPPGFVNEIYYDPLWVPFVKDNGGNNIALDLNPSGSGKWGQIILFGRDYDTKFVVADSFSEFLSNLADDLDNGNYEIDDDEDLNYVYKNQTYNYFDALKFKSIARARKLDEHFNLNERKPTDADVYAKGQRAELNRSLNSAPSLKQQEESFKFPPSSSNNESLPKETLISPVYPQSGSGGSKRDFTPSKENIATTDSFVIDDDADLEENTNDVPDNSQVLADEQPEKKAETDASVSAPVAELEDLNIEEPKEEPKEEPTAENVDEMPAETSEEAETKAEPVAEAEPVAAAEEAEPAAETGPVESEKAEDAEDAEDTEDAEDAEMANSTSTGTNAASAGKKNKNKKKNKKKGKK